jgi:hypothetical protein
MNNNKKIKIWIGNKSTKEDCTKFALEARYWWIKPVILATWKTETGRITVLDSPGKYFVRPHFQNNYSKMDRRLRSKASALQARSSEFWTQSHKNALEKHKWFISEREYSNNIISGTISFLCIYFSLCIWHNLVKNCKNVWKVEMVILPTESQVNNAVILQFYFCFIFFF